MPQGRPWERYGAPQQSAPPPVIYGPPKTEDPLDRRLKSLEATQREAQIAETQRKAEEQRQKAEKFESSKASALASLRNVIAKIDEVGKDASDNRGWGETGFTGAIMRNVPGSPALDLAENIKTIDASSAFSALQAMRESSPTGGALGQITERELELLKSTVSNLSTSQSQGQFLSNLKNARDFYLDMYKRAGGDPADFEVKPPSGARPQLPADQYDAALGRMIREGASAADIAKFAQESGYTIANPEALEAATQGRAFKLETSPELDAIGLGLGGVVEGAGDVLGIVGNPLNATINATGIPDALGVGPLSTDLGATLREGLGFRRPRGDREEMIDAINTGATSALGFGGLARGAGAALTRFAGPGGGGGGPIAPALRRLGSTPLVDTAAGATGAASGQLAEQHGVGPGGQLLATLAGGALGGAAASRMAPMATAAPPPAPVALARAAEQEGVPISRPILDPGKRDAMAYLESSIGGNRPVRESLERTERAIEDRAARLGGDGTAQEPGVMGQRVQEAGDRYIKRSRGLRDRLYDRAAQMAGDARVIPTAAVKALDEEIAGLSGNPASNKAEIDFLRTVRADLADGDTPIPKTVAELRDLRTGLRGRLSNANLAFSRAEGRVLKALDAAKADIDRDLGRVAPAAVRAYARADKFNRERASEITQVVQRVIGRRDDKLSGEQVWSRVKKMAANDAGRLERVWSKLEPEEAVDAAATIADTLGRRSPDEDFSPALFVAATRGITPEARKIIFGPQGARSIANLRELAKAYRDTAARLNNSRSGVVINWGNEIKSMVTRGGLAGAAGTAVGGPVGGMVGGALGAASGTMARNISARMLMSPNVSRWVARMPRQTTPEAISRHIERLGTIAARDPAIAQDALGLQRYLQQAISSAPTRAAAEEERE
jgi:hypothetical protein